MERIENLTENERLNIIAEEVAFEYGVMMFVEKDGSFVVEACGYHNGEKRDGESEEEYESRIYSDAHNAVMDAIGRIERSEDYDMSAFNEDGEEKWYDCVRDNAVRMVCGWFKGETEDAEM